MAETKQTALLVVDVQVDFCPGGALAVPEGNEVVPTLNLYLEFFYSKDSPTFATRDWHPAQTSHFKEFGGVWPKHCVQNTPGARLHPDLKLDTKTIFLSKGMDPQKDSYSAFQALDRKGKDLLRYLSEMGIKRICVGGLATDYCVKASVLDAVHAGLQVYLLVDAIKGVNLNPGDSLKAIEEMREAGVKIVTFWDVKDLLEGN